MLSVSILVPCIYVTELTDLIYSKKRIIILYLPNDFETDPTLLGTCFLCVESPLSIID